LPTKAAPEKWFTGFQTLAEAMEYADKRLKELKTRALAGDQYARTILPEAAKRQDSSDQTEN
jgi:hypothetical protein